jgi:hypothetical protein
MTNDKQKLPAPGILCEHRRWCDCDDARDGTRSASHVVPWVMVLAAGCIPAVANRVDGPTIAPARVVLMPPVALVYMLDAGDQREGQAEPSNEIASHLTSYLGTIAYDNKARMAELPRLEECGRPCGRFMRWGTIASLEIGLQREEIRNFGRHSVADWGFEGDLSEVRKTLDADYALLVVFKQTRETTGRRVLFALGGGYTIGKQIDVACIADLRDGHMVWCATKRDDAHDLGEGDRARAALLELLQGVFRVR